MSFLVGSCDHRYVYSIGRCLPLRADRRYGGGAGGINSGPAHISAYAMRDIYLAPWRSMVQRAGLRALMRSHEQWDHWPVHASTELPQWIESIGFNDSWSISDCGDIVNLVAFQVCCVSSVAYVSDRGPVELVRTTTNSTDSVVCLE